MPIKRGLNTESLNTGNVQKDAKCKMENKRKQEAKKNENGTIKMPAQRGVNGVPKYRKGAKTWNEQNV